MNAPVAPEAVAVDRRAFIGGSDAAAILGVSPWATPLDVYMEKVGQKKAPVDPAREKLFRRGKRMEPIVVDMLIEEYGIKVTKRSTPFVPNRYNDAEHDFLAAEIDFEWEVTAEAAERFGLDEALIGTIQNGEVKTVHPFASAKFGDAETDEIPIEYAAQAMHGLMIARRDVTMFGVLIGADDLVVYWIHRDDKIIAGMRAKELAFWSAHVLAGVPPAPVNLPDVLQLFGQAEPISIQADKNALEVYGRYLSAKATEKQVEGEIEDLKFQLGCFMLGVGAVELDARGKVKPAGAVHPGKHLLMAGDKPLLTVAHESQTRIDSDAVRRLHPEVAAQCSKTSSFYKFNLPRKKS